MLTGIPELYGVSKWWFLFFQEGFRVRESASASSASGRLLQYAALKWRFFQDGIGVRESASASCAPGRFLQYGACPKMGMAVFPRGRWRPRGPSPTGACNMMPRKDAFSKRASSSARSVSCNMMPRNGAPFAHHCLLAHLKNLAHCLQNRHKT